VLPRLATAKTVVKLAQKLRQFLAHVPDLFDIRVNSPSMLCQ